MNVNFEYSKTLAGEGAVLLLLSLLPTVGWVLGIVGVVLLAKAMKEFSYYYQDESIYQNAWTGIKYYIVAIIASAVAIGVGLVSFATAGLFAGAPVGFTLGFVGGIVAILAGLAVAFVFYVLAATHLRKMFNTIAKKSGEQSLETAGTLLWIGSILTIFGIGLISDIHRLDICNNRILHHEVSPIPTIHLATKQLWLYSTANTTRASKKHGNQPKHL